MGRWEGPPHNLRTHLYPVPKATRSVGSQKIVGSEERARRKSGAREGRRRRLARPGGGRGRRCPGLLPARVCQPPAARRPCWAPSAQHGTHPSGCYLHLETPHAQPSTSLPLHHLGQYHTPGYGWDLQEQLPLISFCSTFSRVPCLRGTSHVQPLPYTPAVVGTSPAETATCHYLQAGCTPPASLIQAARALCFCGWWQAPRAPEAPVSLVGAAACSRCAALAIEALSLLIQSVMADALYPPLLRELQSAAAPGHTALPVSGAQGLQALPELMNESSGALGAVDGASALEPGQGPGGPLAQARAGWGSQRSTPSRALHKQAAVLRESKKPGPSGAHSGAGGNPGLPAGAPEPPLLSVAASVSKSPKAAPGCGPEAQKEGGPGAEAGARARRGSCGWSGSLPSGFAALGIGLQVLLNVLVPKVRAWPLGSHTRPCALKGNTYSPFSVVFLVFPFTLQLFRARSFFFFFLFWVPVLQVLLLMGDQAAPCAALAHAAWDLLHRCAVTLPECQGVCLVSSGYTVQGLILWLRAQPHTQSLSWGN